MYRFLSTLFLQGNTHDWAIDLASHLCSSEYFGMGSGPRTPQREVPGPSPMGKENNTLKRFASRCRGPTHRVMQSHTPRHLRGLPLEGLIWFRVKHQILIAGRREGGPNAGLDHPIAVYPLPSSTFNNVKQTGNLIV